MKEEKFKKVKTSIRDIKVSERREKIDSVVSSRNKAKIHTKPPRSKGSFKKKNKKRWPKIVGLATFFFIILVTFSILFHSVNIKVKPIVESIIFKEDNVYHAVANKNENKKLIDTIEYKLFDFSFNNKKDINSFVVEETKKNAKGKIKIVNNSEIAQKLRKETRFRTGDKIYMTEKSITVPAKSSVVTDAFATEPGKEFNIKKGVKLDIPGFEEIKSPLFEKMFGEVATDFSGGFIGKTNIPKKDELDLSKKEAEEKLTLKLKEQLYDKIPSEYILVDKNLFKTITHKTLSKDNKVVLDTTLNVKAILFKKDDFLNLILNEKSSNDLILSDESNLKFNIPNIKKFSVNDASNFDFTLKGKANFTRKFDKDAFLAMIKGKSKKEVEDRLKDNFKNFNFDISFRPFWRSSVPDDVEKIKIEVLKNN